MKIQRCQVMDDSVITPRLRRDVSYYTYIKEQLCTWPKTYFVASENGKFYINIYSHGVRLAILVPEDDDEMAELLAFTLVGQH